MNLYEYLFEFMQVIWSFVVCGDQSGGYVTSQFVGDCHNWGDDRYAVEFRKPWVDGSLLIYSLRVTSVLTKS